MEDDSWYVLHVKSNQERAVARQLTGRSIEHYVPFYTERRRWTDRTVITERPLFPGYVFTRFVPQDRISVISSSGIIRLIGEQASDLISAVEIERIRSGLAANMLMRPHLGVVVGTRVKVLNGVFAGMEGKVSELRQRCRVILTPTTIKQSFSLEVQLEDVEVLE